MAVPCQSLNQYLILNFYFVKSLCSNNKNNLDRQKYNLAAIIFLLYLFLPVLEHSLSCLLIIVTPGTGIPQVKVVSCLYLVLCYSTVVDVEMPWVLPKLVVLVLWPTQTTPYTYNAKRQTPNAKRQTPNDCRSYCYSIVAVVYTQVEPAQPERCFSVEFNYAIEIV